MQDASTPASSRKIRPRHLIGGLIVVLGVLLLVDTTGVVDVDGSDVFVAGALVAYGGYRLIRERGRHLFWPGTLLLVGLGWLLVEFGVLTGAQAGQFWPVLLVLFGASLLRGRRQSDLFSVEPRGVDGREASAERGITTVFGDARLDLRGVDLPRPSVVEAVAVFGDADVVVPDDWVVVVEATTIFGDVRDQRRSHPAGDPDLILDGVAVFGDVRLTD
jgi:hypothetical protein